LIQNSEDDNFQPVRANPVTIFPLGDSALTVEFGKQISAVLNQNAIALSDHFKQNPFAGFVETVPAYASTTIFYDLIEVRQSFPQFSTAYDAVKSFAENALKDLNKTGGDERRLIEIPVNFAGEYGPDLAEVAKYANVTADEVVELFTSDTYRVFMLGFLPGFAYMGEVDERIAIPRHKTPRSKVAKGSVGIAGRQTGIYSLESPGGWQIIGRTDVGLFSPGSDPPCFLRPGDSVRFVDVRRSKVF
jgi:inhibitor of KinA